jgi:hypothetical protein
MTPASLLIQIGLEQREKFLTTMTRPEQLAYLCGALSQSLDVDVLRAAIEKIKETGLPDRRSMYAALAGYLAGVVSDQHWKETVDRCNEIFAARSTHFISRKGGA